MKAFREYLAESRIPKELEGLAAEARKAPSYIEFERDYLWQIKHGIYWHVTDDPNFRIDSNKGPRDMSSMATNAHVEKGALMFTSHLEYWTSGYGKTRPYAALLDLSRVPRDKYKQVSRGFGNEFFLQDASKVKVIRVMPIRQALQYDRKVSKMKPATIEAIKEFYEKATGKEAK